KILNFLYVNGAILFGLVAYMFLWRPRRKPSRLKLSERGEKRKLQVPQGHPAVGHVLSEDSAVRRARELNVIFQYNGHDFDAHEVLGIDAGSSKETAQKALDELLRNSDSSSHEFYRLAYKAISGSV